MKKLTQTRVNWFQVRARAENEKRRRSPKLAVLDTANGKQVVAVSNARPLPNTLCLDNQLENTVKFFNQLRKATLKPKSHFSHMPTSRKSGKVKTLRNYYDFETLETISPGAALILASEFDRINSVSKLGPSTINLDDWNDLVYGTFFHLGFFELLGFSKERIRKQEAARPPNLQGLVVMPMKTGTNADLKDGIEAIKELFSTVDGDEETSLKLSSAIVDAIENVVNHAYKDLPTPDRDFIPRKWWISGSTSQSDRTVTVYVYDQGISIPVSLPLTWNNDRLFASVMAKFGVAPWKDNRDGEAVCAAMVLSTSSTKISSRGKGLHKIKEAMSQLNKGSLTILSRKGYYRWEGGREVYNAMESALFGTYVELKAKF